MSSRMCGLIETTGFSANQVNANWTSGGLRRAGTIVKSPLELRKDKDKDKQPSGNRSPQEVVLLTCIHEACYFLTKCP